MRQSIFIGKMIGDPQIRQTQGGTPVLNFELMTMERQGEVWEKHNFRMVLFGISAVRLANQAKNGSEIVVIAKPESRTYKNKTGNTCRSEDHRVTWARVCLPEGTEDTPNA